MSRWSLAAGILVAAAIPALVLTLLLTEERDPSPAETGENGSSARETKAVSGPGAGSQEKPPTRTRFVLLAGRCVTVELALSRAERVQGLSGRPALPADTGMLFVYDSEGYPSIWMKEMNFPIDILWLSAERRVVDRQLSVSPDTYPRSFSPARPARYVLELPAGFAAEHKVEIGEAAVFRAEGCSS